MNNILQNQNIFTNNIEYIKTTTNEKKKYILLEIRKYLISQKAYNSFLYVGENTIYESNNKLVIKKRTNKKNYVPSIQHLYRFFGIFKCYYLHGMGYKCNNAINTLYFSVGKSTWENYIMETGAFCYTISRKHSGRKLFVKKNIERVIQNKDLIADIYIKKKIKSRHKKRKLRTRVKLLRNYHGLLFLYSMGSHQLHKMGGGIQTIRIPNVYTGKGVHYYKHTFAPQERKLKSFFYKK